MVKKRELKQRAIYVYPSSEMSEYWKRLAQEAEISISKFVIEHVQNSRGLEDQDYVFRGDLVGENRRLLEAIREKDKRIEHLDLLVEKLQEDLRIQRDKLFTDSEYSGVRNYDKKLIEVLKEDGLHSSDEIIARLGLRPRDVDSIRSVSIQLENLEQYCLIKPSPKGYQWVG
jgi:hypothetical protein